MQAERKVLTVRRFIFLTSSSFSGSTLLAFALGAHPRIATASALTGRIDSIDSEDYVCSCGNLLAHCSFWNSISIRMRRSHEEFSINDFKTRYKPLSQSVTDKLQFSDLTIQLDILCERLYISTNPQISGSSSQHYEKKY